MLCEVGAFSIPVNPVHVLLEFDAPFLIHNCRVNIVNVLSAGSIVAICIDVSSPVSDLNTCFIPKLYKDSREWSSTTQVRPICMLELYPPEAALSSKSSTQSVCSDRCT